MTAVATPVRSRVVLQTNPAEPAVGVAAELLHVLGHAVETAATPEAAIVAVGPGRAALLVLSVTDADEQRQSLERLALLPHTLRPLRVAFLTEEDAETAPLLRRALPGVKVTVFVKPVHALGLLDLVKRLDATG